MGELCYIVAVKKHANIQVNIKTENILYYINIFAWRKFLDNFLMITMFTVTERFNFQHKNCLESGDGY